MTNGGTLVKRCGLSFEEVCRYKYMLNVGSNGYANKLKYLFLCGSVVIWVRKDSLNHEFFERHLVPGRPPWAAALTLLLILTSTLTLTLAPVRLQPL